MEDNSENNRIKESPEYFTYINNSNYPDEKELSEALNDLKEHEFHSTNELINERAKKVEQIIIDKLL